MATKESEEGDISLQILEKKTVVVTLPALLEPLTTSTWASPLYSPIMAHLAQRIVTNLKTLVHSQATSFFNVIDVVTMDHG